jgi:iron complex transport system ATP-binding protein
LEDQFTIQLKNLQLGYKSKQQEFLIGNPMTASASKGQLVALIGANGCGKSTLLRTISKLQQPISGEVKIKNIPVNQLNRLQMAKLVGLVTTDLERTANLNVYELVALGRFPHNNWLGQITDFDDQIIREAIKSVGMEHFTKKNVINLSDGEYQRVMIARALAQDTEVIILDEPTAFLDLPNKYSTVNLLWDLTRKVQKTILFSTHDLNIAMQFADLVWIMAKDSLCQGAPEELLINGSFDHIFTDRSVVFDHQSFQFKKQKTWRGEVGLAGDDRLAVFTRMALERVGIKTESNKTMPLSVKVMLIDNKPIWILKKSDEIINYHHLGELTNFIESIV